MNSSSCPYLLQKRLHVKKVGIIVKKDDAHAKSSGLQVEKWLVSRNIEVVFERICQDLDLLIILGGDGTLLHIAEQAAKYSIPVAGINLGHLGFLTEFTENEASQAIADILEKEVCIENRLMLKTRLIKNEVPSSYRYALNEIVINKNTSDPLLYLETYSGTDFITTYQADGLIFSTPTGSTAYNLSAGGPLVHPGLATVLVTPICPFMLSSRPIILPATTLITTIFQAQKSTDYAQIIVDGRQHWQIEDNDQLEIDIAEHPLQLITSPHRNYFNILCNKLHWGRQKQHPVKNR